MNQISRKYLFEKKNLKMSPKYFRTSCLNLELNIFTFKKMKNYLTLKNTKFYVHLLSG